MNSATWRIGSEIIPSKPLTTNEEFFQETLKCFGSISDLNWSPSVDIDSYTLNAPVLGTNSEINGSGASGASVGSASFALGTDLEVYSNAPSDAFFMGINTNTADTFINIVNNPGTAFTMRVDTFAFYDKVLYFENGNAYVKY